MELENVVYEVSEGIATVTVSRPKVLNALNAQTLNELETAFSAAIDDDDVRAIILTGAGEKSFVAGADINEIRELDLTSGKRFSLRGQMLLNLIEHCDKPVICAVNGYALGGGCEIALACHIRIAAANALFGQPEVKLGIIPGYGGTQRLARLIGKGKALEIILTGDNINAEEALRIGLVNNVVPPEELLPAAHTIAHKIIANGPVAVQLAMESVDRGLELTLDEGLRIEADLFAAACNTEDKNEGTTAFLEKRKPQFKNR